MNKIHGNIYTIERPTRAGEEGKVLIEDFRFTPREALDECAKRGPEYKSVELEVWMNAPGDPVE